MLLQLASRPDELRRRLVKNPLTVEVVVALIEKAAEMDRSNRARESAKKTRRSQHYRALKTWVSKKYEEHGGKYRSKSKFADWLLPQAQQYIEQRSAGAFSVDKRAIEAYLPKRRRPENPAS
jgi:hypothetical protein